MKPAKVFHVKHFSQFGSRFVPEWGENQHQSPFDRSRIRKVFHVKHSADALKPGIDFEDGFTYAGPQT